MLCHSTPRPVPGILALIAFSACSEDPASVDLSQPPEADLPEQQVDLGRMLFWDPILSGEHDVACATCHHPQFSYGDGRDLSVGVGGVGVGPARVDTTGGRVGLVPRNAPTVLNTLFNGQDQAGVTPDQATAPMFWDLRALSLEEQALLPLQSRAEMRGDAGYTAEEAVDVILARLAAIPSYVSLFEDSFGESGVTAENLATALAQFQRTLTANQSRVDLFRAGDQTALTDLEERGMRTFERVGCADCHSGPMFSDFELHVLGVADDPRLSEPDAGDGTFAFRTPTLRNVELTAPYMHNGSRETLRDVLEFYVQNNQSRNPNVPDENLDQDFTDVNLNRNQIPEVEAFLRALSDREFDQTVPQSVPSGLPVGGSLE